MSQVRDRVCVPPSHDAEQILQADQWPSTASEVEKAMMVILQFIYESTYYVSENNAWLWSKLISHTWTIL